MGNSLEQYRASIGLYHSGAGAGQKRIEPDVFWVALKDLLLMILLLQCLTFGFFEMQLQRLHQPGCGSGEEASFVFCILATKVAIKYLCICLFVPEWVRFRVGFIKVCYDGECSRRPFLHFSAFPVSPSSLQAVFKLPSDLHTRHVMPSVLTKKVRCSYLVQLNIR